MTCDTLKIHVCRFANSKRKEATIKWYENNLRPLIDFFGAECSVHTIGRIEADEYWGHIRNRRDYLASHPSKPTLTRRLSDTTLHNFLRAVRTFWNALVKQRVVEYNVFDHLSYVPDKQRVEMKAVSPEDLRALREVAKESSVRDYAIVTVLATSGMRAGELVSMTMENLKVGTGEALVYGKRGWRKVFLGKASTEAIKLYLKERPEISEGALWLNVYNKPLTTDGIRQMIGRLAGRANVKGRHNLHSFRHRFAQAWLDKGMNAQILSKALGHADVTVTLLIYGNQDDRRVAMAMRQLEMSPFEDPEGLEEL